MYGQGDSVAITHRVQLGENLYRISLKYKVDAEKLREWNELSSNSIQAGQTIIIGFRQSDESSPATTEISTSSLNALQRLKSLVERVQSLYYESLVRQSDLEDSVMLGYVNELFEGQYSKTSHFELIQALNQSRIEALKNDVGLGFYSGITHNFRPGVFDGEDLFFRSRASLGLDWQLLGNGLSANKDAIRKLEIENELSSLLQLKDAKDQNYVYAYNYVIYLFNAAQQEQLARRHNLIGTFLNLASELYLVRAMSWEGLIELKSKKASLESMQKNLSNYNRGFDSAYAELPFNRTLDAGTLPILEIIPDRIFAGVSMDSVQARMLDLENQKLQIDYKKEKDWGLRTFARYNIFDSQGSSLRTFGSIGATFTAPLFRNKRNNELQQKELAVLESQVQSELTTVNNELMNHYYEYQYTLKQYIDFLGNKELAQERLRRELARDYLSDPTFTPLNTILYLDELYAIDFELLDLKQKLYLKLLKIYSLLDIEQMDEITYPLNVDDYFDKMAGSRAVYAWSESLEAYETEFIAKYAINNEFKRLFLSQGQHSNDLVIEMVRKYQQSGGRVFKLVGNNELARTLDSAALDQLTDLAILQGFNGLQIDSEPHTFPDWSGNQQSYLDQLLASIDYIKGKSSDYLGISVSIPVFYPEEFLSQLGPKVDEVVLMCYERTDLDAVVNAIKEEVGLFRDKISLAFRTDDFEDRLVLERFVKEVINSTGIDRVVIHDLNSLITLDQKTILGK